MENLNKYLKIKDFEFVSINEAIIEVSFFDNDTKEEVILRGLVDMRTD
jgi:hypothetical protein